MQYRKLRGGQTSRQVSHSRGIFPSARIGEDTPGPARYAHNFTRTSFNVPVSQEARGLSSWARSKQGRMLDYGSIYHVQEKAAVPGTGRYTLAPRSHFVGTKVRTGSRAALAYGSTVSPLNDTHDCPHAPPRRALLTPSVANFSRATHPGPRVLPTAGCEDAQGALV